MVVIKIINAALDHVLDPLNTLPHRSRRQGVLTSPHLQVIDEIVTINTKVTISSAFKVVHLSPTTPNCTLSVNITTKKHRHHKNNFTYRPQVSNRPKNTIKKVTAMFNKPAAAVLSSHQVVDTITTITRVT